MTTSAALGRTIKEHLEKEGFIVYVKEHHRMSRDIFGVFDGFAIHPQSQVFFQICTAKNRAVHRRKMDEIIPKIIGFFPASAEFWLIVFKDKSTKKWKMEEIGRGRER